MTQVCFPVLQREKRTMVNDPFERMSVSAQASIVASVSAFAAAHAETGVTPSEGELLALRRAHARFLIDSGLASANGYV